MSEFTNSLNAVDALIMQGIQDGAFPGAALWIGWRGQTVKCTCYGQTADREYGTYHPVPATTRTLYDLASLTKVVATTSTILHLVEQGLLRLTDPLSTYLPMLAEDRQKAAITIEQVLTHTGGFPGPAPLYRQYQGKEGILAGIYRQPLSAAPGTRAWYSDLGFILLGEVVHVASGMPLDAYARTYLFGPLGMYDTLFAPVETMCYPIAPTEDVAWRGGLVHGQVHDENAAAMGGAAGHAGLFSTIEDMGIFCQMLLGMGEYKGRRVLAAKSILDMTTPRVRDDETSIGLGWMMNAPYIMGKLADDSTCGHTGFTGTSIVFNMPQQLAVVLLTNRVCPTRNGPDINRYRRGVADAAMTVLPFVS